MVRFFVQKHDLNHDGGVNYCLFHIGELYSEHSVITIFFQTVEFFTINTKLPVLSMLASEVFSRDQKVSYSWTRFDDH